MSKAQSTKEVTGFPNNGFWYVNDGHYMLVVPVDHPRPIELLKYTQHKETLVNYLCDVFSNKILSLNEEVQIILTKLEELNTAQIKAEKQLLSDLLNNPS